MKKIEIYTKGYCPYCSKAKALLEAKSIKYTEYDVQHDEEKFSEMLKRADGRRTVPQVFIDDIGIGGCDDLYALDKSGGL